MLVGKKSLKIEKEKIFAVVKIELSWKSNCTDLGIGS